MKSIAAAAAAFALVFSASAQEAAHDPDPAGIHGGLIVQLGTADLEQAAALSKTGRHLVHVLAKDDPSTVDARVQLKKDGWYGLAFAETLADPKRLPYAENVVNAVVVHETTVPLTEIFRVLTPEGRIVVTAKGDAAGREALEGAGFEHFEEKGGTLIARKPWPESMDTWSHPRHDADGNAVSTDTSVGPPERVRWVAAATQEVEGLVAAGGRNFYGGVLARDSFNGLRLWHRDLGRGEHNSDEFKLPRLSYSIARPVASANYLFAINQGKLVALDAATGEVVRDYPGLEKPKELVHHRDKVIATDAKSVRCFSTETGDEVWAVVAGEPRNLAAGDDLVSLIQGQPKRGEKSEALALDLYTGDVKWRRNDLDFLDKVYRTVQYGDHLAFECSSLNDNDNGNAIHVVSSKTGADSWSKAYPPGMNHARQARPMFMEDEVWILHGGKVNYEDKENMKRLPIQVSALNPANGETLKTHKAGLAHCFPPVATTKYLFAGELDLTDLESGDVIANRITKANCSRENGWVPANGLVYTTPKHCTCWPMLRGFVAMAGKPPVENHPAYRPTEELKFKRTEGPAIATPDAPAAKPSDWPVYRSDKWRSGSSASAGLEKLDTLWSVRLSSESEEAVFAGKPTGPILHDWAENAFVKGPVSPPTIARGIAYVARPDAHEVVAFNTANGEEKWRFTADGRVDLPPSIHQGLATFGTHMGTVYALRADNGEPVWQIDAGLTDERIVAYGQVESPWPVAGSVLLIGDDAFFAAGRQPFADGGVFVHSVKAQTGEPNWVYRVDTLPQKGYYENSGLEFDPVDVLHQEGDAIAMSRWIISMDGSEHSVDKWQAFSKIAPGDSGDEAWIPRGSWTYGPRHQHRFRGEAPRRPLVVASNGNVVSSLNGSTDVFLRDFEAETVESFDHKWITGWSAGGIARDGGKPYRTYRVAEGAKWTVDPYTPAEEKKELPPGTQVYNDIHAMALSAADGKVYTVHKDGRLAVLSLADGKVLAERKVPPPAWDGLAIADGKLFLATKAGELVCLGN